MVERLTDKIALITGTANGQGRAAALLFAQEGPIVVGCDLKGDENQQTVQMVSEACGQMDAATLDITEAQAAKNWVNDAANRHEGIDIVYNNAAFLRRLNTLKSYGKAGRHCLLCFIACL